MTPNPAEPPPQARSIPLASAGGRDPGWFRVLGGLIVLIVGLASFVRYGFFVAWQPLTTNGDASQHLWWMRNWREPGLFEGNLLFEYFSDPALSPPGHRAMFWLVSRLMDPLVFAEWLVLPMFIGSVAACYVLGVRCGGGRVLGGIAAVMTFVLVEVGLEMIGGMARSHAWLILPIAATGWVSRDGRWVAAGLLYGAFFYPPMAALGGVITLLMVLYDIGRNRSLARAWGDWSWPKVMVVGGVLTVGMLLWFQSQGLPEAFGPRITGDEARQMAEFGPHGRNEFFHADPWTFVFDGIRSGIGVTPQRALLFVVLVGTGLWFLPRAVPAAAWVVLIGSLAMWGLAHLLLFKLYLPSRYTLYSIPMFMMMWAGAVTPRAMPALRRHRRFAMLHGAVTRPGVAWGLVILAGLNVSYAELHTARSLLASRQVPDKAPGFAEAMDYLQSLPPDTLVAAHPYDADRVTILARRPVVASFESSIAYHRGYYAQVRPRISAVLDATFATDWSAMDQLHDAYGVDVYLVNTRRYTLDAADYWAPFGEAIRENFEARRAQGFAVFSPPPERVLFDLGEIKIFWLGPIDQRPEPAPAPPPVVGDSLN